jgi:hypothetical protein
MWIWVAVGAAVFALAVVLAFARILGSIGKQVAELQDTMMWADWPTSPRRVGVDEPAEFQTASTA